MALFGTSAFKGMGGVSAKTYQDSNRVTPVSATTRTSAVIQAQDPAVAKTVVREVQALSIPTTTINPVSTAHINSPVFGGGTFGASLAQKAAEERAKQAALAAQQALGTKQNVAVTRTKTVMGPFGHPVTVPVTNTTASSSSITTLSNSVRDAVSKESETLQASITLAKAAAEAATKAAEKAQQEADKAIQEQAALEALLNKKATITKTVTGPLGKITSIPVSLAGPVGLSNIMALQKQIELAKIKAQMSSGAAALAKINADKKVEAASTTATQSSAAAAKAASEQTSEQVSGIAKLFGNTITTPKTEPVKSSVVLINDGDTDKSISAAKRNEALFTIFPNLKQPVSGIPNLGLFGRGWVTTTTDTNVNAQIANAVSSTATTTTTTATKPVTDPFGFIKPSTTSDTNKTALNNKTDTISVSNGVSLNKTVPTTSAVTKVTYTPVTVTSTSILNSLSVLRKSGMFGTLSYGGATKAPNVTETKISPFTSLSAKKGFSL